MSNIDENVISPYEITLVKAPDIRMSGFCRICLFYEQKDMRSENIQLQCGLMNHRIKFNDTAGEGIMMCMPLVYTLVHKITGETLSPFQVGMMYSEHRVQHNEFFTVRN